METSLGRVTTKEQLSCTEKSKQEVDRKFEEAEGILDKPQDSIDNLPIVLYLQKHMNLKSTDIRSYSPLTLAYIGDCIYELVIRTMLVEEGNAPVNKLHRRASNLVKASAQKDLLHKIEPLLTEQEIGIYKRGRNAKSFTSAKNATIGEYRTATGFEALMGYLYLDNQMNRMVELIKKGLEK